MSSIDIPGIKGATRTNSLFSSHITGSPAATSTPYRSLARAVFDRRDEYLTKGNVRIKIGSWNVAALEGTENDLKSWFVQGKGRIPRLAGVSPEDEDGFSAAETAVETIRHQEHRAAQNGGHTTPLNDREILPADENIGIYVLGLQETVDISSATGALRPYNDTAIAKKWKDAVHESLPSGYTFVAEHQLIGLYLIIYASQKISKSISSVSTNSVGTGLMGYMGNKGAVSARIVLGEVTKIVFINAHLAAGNEKGSLERRNWDALQISQKTKFEPIDHGNGIVDEKGEGLGAEHYAFWFGDLNYRLDTLPGDDIRRLLMLHTEDVNDNQEQKQLASTINNHAHPDASLPIFPSTPHGTSAQFSVSIEEEEEDEDEVKVDGYQSHILDQDEPTDAEDDPASLQTTLKSLLPHDQLLQQMKARTSFHDGWREGPLKFLPTYKYDVGKVGVFDSSEKRRSPSWCDRVLFRTQADYTRYLKNTEAEGLAKKRDEEMKSRGLDQGPDDSVLFDYDPETDGATEVANTEGQKPSSTAEYDENADVTKSDLQVTPHVQDDSLYLEHYTSHQRVLSSDHKPLNAVFHLTYDAVNYDRKAEITAEIAKELDRDENEARPTLTLIVDQIDQDKNGKGEIDFGHVAFDEPKLHSITVANTGSVAAHFGLVADETPQESRNWLQIIFENDEKKATKQPQTFSIEPGDTMNATCILHVTEIGDVQSLNSGTARLDNVRILRVQDGRDHFITSRGVWLHSCFGLSLEQLIRIPEGGVRSCALGSELDKGPVKWSAPRELFRMTEALEESIERAIAEWEMKEEGEPPWDAAGWPFLTDTWTFTGPDRATVKKSIRDGLDSGQDFVFDPHLSSVSKVEALAETLVTFLKSIDNAIIDEDLWSSLSSALQNREKQNKDFDSEAQRALILEELSVSSSRSVAFTLITFMLARIANELAPATTETQTESTSAVVKASELLKGRLSGRKTGVDHTVNSKRREVEKKFANVFASAIFQIPVDAKAKEKRAEEDRRRAVVSAFLHGQATDKTL